MSLNGLCLPGCCDGGTTYCKVTSANSLGIYPFFTGKQYITMQGPALAFGAGPFWYHGSGSDTNWLLELTEISTTDAVYSRLPRNGRNITAWVRLSGGTFDTVFNTAHPYSSTLDFGYRYIYYVHSMYWSNGMNVYHVIPNPACTGYTWAPDDTAHYAVGIPAVPLIPGFANAFQSVLAGPIGSVPSTFTLTKTCSPDDDPLCSIPLAAAQCRHEKAVSHVVTCSMNSSSIQDGWVTGASYLGSTGVCSDHMTAFSGTVTWGSGSNWRRAITGDMTANWWCRNGSPNATTPLGGVPGTGFQVALDGGWTIEMGGGVGQGIPCQAAGFAGFCAGAYPISAYSFTSDLASLGIS